ncbi:MAG: DnaJ C-terminal domain-containing protein, partial [Actinomycetia bacterium]|nr:DnaJ C-terminal domain-containing protein [Actinomycetes bacterium]
TCHGAGDVVTVQRSFLGDIRTSQPCPTCRGFGTVIPNPCPECSGDGRIRAQRTISIKIPPGVASGNRIHLEAQGEVGSGGGPAGDLYVEIQVAEHEVFKRKGDDLDVVIRVPMTAAALGTAVPLATLEAERDDQDPELVSITVDVPAGTQSGTRVVVRDRGVPRLRGHGRGNLNVIVLVQTPASLDDEQRELLRRLAELRGETAPEAQVDKTSQKGVFGWLKEAFGG